MLQITTVDAGFLCHKADMLRHTTKRTLYYSTSDRLLKKEEEINNTVFKMILTHKYSSNKYRNHQMQFPADHSNNESTNEHSCQHNHDKNQVAHQEGQQVNWFLLQTDNISTYKLKFPADI
jgi:hypothetical protein